MFFAYLKVKETPLCRFEFCSMTISCGDGISPDLTTYLCMQNKDDSLRPCFALLRREGKLLAMQLKDILSRHLRATLPEGGKLLRRVGTLLAVQLKDILSRHLRATLPDGESFFSRHSRAILPERGKLLQRVGTPSIKRFFVV